MDAGVSIVGLDHVAEHERGSPICGVELKQRLEALVTLSRKHCQDRQQRHRRKHRESVGMDLLGDDQPNTGQSSIDRVDPQFRELLA